MQVKPFTELVKSESVARKYLLQFCWKNHQRSCPRCRTRKLYRLAEGRRRCSRCRYTFHDFSGRFVNVGRFSCVDWLWVLKFFELDASATTIAGQLGVTRNTAENALRTLRQAIMAHALDAQLFVQAGLLQGANPAAPPVFGILERRGWAFVDLLQDVTPEALVHFRSRFHLRTAVQGRVVYTDSYRHYDTLAFYAPDDALAAVFRSGANQGAMYVHGKQGFWSQVRERLRRVRGVGARYFPLYLKEMEFRYNRRGEDVFPLLAQQLCSFVPEVEQDPPAGFDRADTP